MDFVLNKLPLKIAKKLLDNMTDSVVNWAAGGFKKEGPSFISNFDEYAKNNAIELGTVLIDEIVEQGEQYAVKSLNTTEVAELKKCTDNEKKYQKTFALVKTGLLKSGIDLFGNGTLFSLENNGVDQFNKVFTDKGYPAYVQSALKYNNSALIRFIEDEIMGDPDVWARTGLSGSVPYVDIRKQVDLNDTCQQTLFLKARGLSYTSELVTFVGKTYRDGRKGSASTFGVPNFENFGQAYTKSLSENWKAFQTDASRGGWDAFNETAKLENTPWGAKYKAQAELSDHLAVELGEKTAQLQRNSGFLDKGECKKYKQLEKAGGTEEICIDYQSNTPGSVIRESVNKRVLQQYDQLNNVEKWSDLLLTTGVKLVSGVLREGVLPLANNAIDKGLSCLAGSCEDAAFGETTVASSQTITNSGNGVSLDDVVDIKSVLYGPAIVQKDENDNIIYERKDEAGNIVREKRDANNKLIQLVARAPADVKDLGGTVLIKEGQVLYTIKEFATTDANGVKTIDKYIATKPNGTRYTEFGTNGESTTLEPEIVTEYSRPQYAYEYETDASGKETDVLKYERNQFTGDIITDLNGRKVPKLKRHNGAIQLANELQTLLTVQYTFVRTQGVRKLLDLDHALPGPDLGWEERLKEKGQASIDKEGTSKKKSGMRELYEQIKLTFENGFYGNLVNDPFDIVAIGVGNGNVYGNPRFAFQNFQYPVRNPETGYQDPDILQIAPNGAILPQTDTTAANYQQRIDKTFPTTMTLIKQGETTASQYHIIPMNTHAGLWFNPVTKQIEAVGNLPDAQEMRELSLSAESQYKSAVDSYKRRGNDLRILQTKLTELQRRYESLPNNGPGASLEDRVARTRLEDEIAYEISIIRDKLPIYDEVSEIKSQLKDILTTYDRMSEMIEGTDNYRGKSTYATRFGDLQQYRGKEQEDTSYKGVNYYVENQTQAERYRDLYLKDKLGILYCGLQDHSLLNTHNLSEKKLLAKEIGKSVETQSWALALFSPSAALFHLNGSDMTINPFGGKTSITQKAKWLQPRSRETYNYLVPYRCFESSVICDDKDNSCTSFSWECPFGGENIVADQSFMLMSMVVPCKSIYTSSVGDYLKQIDPDAGQ